MTGAGGPIHRSEPLPIARSVLWGLVGASPPQPLKQQYPIFLHQKPLRQLLAHTRSAPDKILLGLLLGDVCQCPESGIRYLAVEQMLRVDTEAAGDKTAALMAQLWPRLQEKLKGQTARPVGWYHSHPGGGLTLSPDDIEAHSKHFAESWQAVLLLGTENGKPIGGWFRATPDDGWTSTPLPFYEVLAPESIDASGKKRSFVDWGNYKGYQTLPPAAPAVPKEAAPPAAPAAATRRPSGPAKRPSVSTARPEAGPPAAPAEPAKSAAAAPRSVGPPPQLKPAAPREPAPPQPAPPREEAAPPARTPPLVAQTPSPPPPVEQEKPAGRQSLTFTIPDEVEAERPAPRAPTPPWSAPPPPPPPPPPPAPPPPPPSVAAPASAPAARPVVGATKSQEMQVPRRSTRVLPLRLIVSGAVGAGVMSVLVLAAWLLGVIHFAHPAESAAGAPPEVAVSQAPAPQSPPSQSAGTQTAAPDPQPGAGQAAPTQSAPGPTTPAPPAAAAPNPALIALDQLTDSMLVALRSYRDRRGQFAQGQADCAALAKALGAVEGHWINYHVQGKPRDLVLDAARAARDRSLYAGVDSVETHFDRSACPRP